MLAVSPLTSLLANSHLACLRPLVLSPGAAPAIAPHLPVRSRYAVDAPGWVVLVPIGPAVSGPIDWPHAPRGWAVLSHNQQPASNLCTLRVCSARESWKQPSARLWCASKGKSWGAALWRHAPISLRTWPSSASRG